MENKLDVVCIAGHLIDLCCVRIDQEAIELYTKWMNDESINGYINHHDKTSQYLDEEAWAKKPDESNKHRWCIVERSTRRLIGTCSASVKDSNANIGVCIGEESGRDKGYGTECIKLMVRYAFMQLNAHRVELSVLGKNERAQKCYKNAGFKECGRKHECIYRDGGYEDLILMEILRKDWASK